MAGYTGGRLASRLGDQAMKVGTSALGNKLGNGGGKGGGAGGMTATPAGTQGSVAGSTPSDSVLGGMKDPTDVTSPKDLVDANGKKIISATKPGEKRTIADIRADSKTNAKARRDAYAEHGPSNSWEAMKTNASARIAKVGENLKTKPLRTLGKGAVVTGAVIGAGAFAPAVLATGGAAYAAVKGVGHAATRAGMDTKANRQAMQKSARQAMARRRQEDTARQRAEVEAGRQREIALHDAQIKALEDKGFQVGGQTIQDLIQPGNGRRVARPEPVSEPGIKPVGEPVIGDTGASSVLGDTPDAEY